MESTSNGRNGKRSTAANEDSALLGRIERGLLGESVGHPENGLQPPAAQQSGRSGADPGADDASSMGAAQTFDRVRNALKKATTHLGNPLDSAISSHPTLWGLWSRRETAKGVKLKPCRLSIVPVANGVEATLDDDEMGFTFSVSATLVADVYRLLNDCIEGRGGLIKEKTRGVAARRAAEQAKKVIEQEVRAEVNRRMS